MDYNRHLYNYPSFLYRRKPLDDSLSLLVINPCEFLPVFLYSLFMALSYTNWFQNHVDYCLHIWAYFFWKSLMMNTDGLRLSIVLWLLISHCILFQFYSCWYNYLVKFFGYFCFLVFFFVVVVFLILLLLIVLNLIFCCTISINVKVYCVSCFIKISFFMYDNALSSFTLMVAMWLLTFLRNRNLMLLAHPVITWICTCVHLLFNSLCVSDLTFGLVLFGSDLLIQMHSLGILLF